MGESQLERDFLVACRLLRIPEPIREYQFAPPRRFRFDFAWPDQRVAVEIEGGEYVCGRHTRGRGFSVDCEKYNLAVMANWRVLRFAGQVVRRNALRCAEMVRVLLGQGEGDSEQPNPSMPGC